MTKNPFYFGGIVKDNYFCNRKNDISTLKQDILNGQNILIYAPRRFGKTSLIYRIMEQSEDVKFIYVDLMTVTDIVEFTNIYFDKIAKSLKTPLEKTMSILKDFFRVKPQINATLSDTGNLTFSLDFSKSKKNSVLQEVLQLPVKYAEREKICVVFDEFQEIKNLQIENILRSVIQEHSNKVSYLFLGSKKSIIKAMFSDVKRPFYKSVKHMILNPIKKEEWDKCILKAFNNTNKKISQEYLNRIFDVAKGFPFYTQQICYELWELTDNEIDDKIFYMALYNLIEREREYFATIWDNLTKNQKIALKIVLYANGENLYSSEKAEGVIKTASLQTAIKNLLDKDILDKKNDIYYFQDPVFAYWIGKNQNAGRRNLQ